MNSQPPLPLRPHDLPPLWDGLHVEWWPWRPLMWTTMWFHGYRRQCCGHCASTELPMVTRGVVRAPIANLLVLPVRGPQAGRIRAEHIRGGAPVRWLTAFRCPDCRTDEVWDRGTNETWTLDDSDYGDDGSWPC